MIDGALADCAAEKGQIAAIAVTRGPGSFTGVRLGVVTAKTLAHALGVPLYLLPTLECAARRAAAPGHVVCPVLDARRREIYSAVYQISDSGRLEILREEQVEPCSALLEDLAADESKEIWFCGDAATAKRDELVNALGARARFVPPPWDSPAADVVALDGARLLLEGTPGIDPLMAVPTYLRSSDAERKLVERRA